MIRIKNPLGARVGRHVRRIARHHIFKITIATAVGLFVIANLVVFAAYRNRLYPNSGLAGRQLGNTKYALINKSELVTTKVLFRTPDKQVMVATSDLGISLDWPATTRSIARQKPWLPMVGLFGHKDYSVVIKYDEARYAATSSNVAKELKREAINWQAVVQDGKATLVQGKNGYTVDLPKLKQKLTNQIGVGYVDVPLNPIAPSITDKQLRPLVDELAATQQVSLTYSYNGKTFKPSSSDILSWYDIAGTQLSLNAGKVSNYIAGIGTGQGIRVKNLSQLVTDTGKALGSKTKLSATLIAAPKATKQYTFCVRARNVPESELAGFAAKILSTLNDSRGWSLDGQVSFSQATSGCNMVAWLSTAADMPSFGSICDSLWSCTVFPNVIINYDRWRYASDAWNASSGNLDDYRSMVINHESGHWLGFGHRFCGGAGQQAPVMQQQSISLQGCVFNPWPLSSEKDALKAKLGL